MTRIAVLSDVHGNLPALEAVTADLERHDVDQVVVAGDVINWGPFNREVVEHVLSHHWTVVRGNNEYYLLDYQTARQPDGWKGFTMPPWLHEHVRPYEHIIASWPDTVQLRFRDALPIRVFHGYPDNPWDTPHPLTPLDVACEKLSSVQERYVITAHSHLWLDDDFGRWHVFNSGSVGVPLNYVPDATYMILDGDDDGWRASLRRVQYDRTPLFAEFERQDFVGRIGTVGKLIIKEFETDTLWLYPFKVWLRERYPDEFIHDADVTDAMIAEFIQVDPEPYMPPQYRRANLRSLPET